MEDILLEAAAEVENEYENDEDFEEDGHEEEGGTKNVGALLKKAAQVVDREDEYDTRESLKAASVATQRSDLDIPDNRQHEEDNNRESIAEKLRKADAKMESLPEAEDKMEEKLEDTESECESDFDNCDDYEDAMDFLFCCYHRKIEEISRHLEKGADIHMTDRHGWNPVHWACAKGYDDVLEVLLKEYRGSIKRSINQRDRLAGFTPLHWACVGGHLNCINILFDHNAKKLKNNIGELPVDVVGVDMSSATGKKIAKVFGVRSVEAKSSRSRRK